MTIEAQAQYHRWVLRRKAERIKAHIDEQADAFIKSVRPPTLIDKGMCNYGAHERLRFFECIYCGTNYPEMNGEIRMNFRAITECPCVATRTR